MRYQIGYLRFSLTFLGVSFAIPIFTLLLDYFLSLQMSGAGLGIIPVMLASIYEGSKFGEIEGRVPTRPEVWSISLKLTALAAALSAVLVIIALVFNAGIFAAIGFSAWLAIGFVLIVLLMLACRVFFGMGAKQAMLAKERAEARKRRQ